MSHLLGTGRELWIFTLFSLQLLSTIKMYGYLLRNYGYMWIQIYTLRKHGNWLEEISGLTGTSLWNIGVYENCMWNCACWALVSWLSWSLLSFSPNCSFSWNWSPVKACNIFSSFLLTINGLEKEECCKKKTSKKLFSFISWDYIL